MAKPDLAGVYISDEFVEVVVGGDRRPDVPKSNLFDVHLEGDFSQADWKRRAKSFSFAGREPEVVLDDCCEWIAAHTSNLRSICIASYGPFHSVSKKDRDEGHPDYGRIAITSHGGHRLYNLPLAILFREKLRASAHPNFQVTVDIDVSASVMGEVYLRSFRENGTRDEAMKDQVFGFVKVSFGIGLSFMRDGLPWQGRLHPEGAQIIVPRWQSGIEQIDADEALFKPAMGRNPGSVEALASIHAISERCRPLNFHDLTHNPNHLIWHRQAWYLAHLIWALTCIVSPDRVFLGGRVMGVPGLIEKVRAQFSELIGESSFPDYANLRAIDHFLSICSNPNGGVVGKPGILGALCMAAIEAKTG